MTEKNNTTAHMYKRFVAVLIDETISLLRRRFTETLLAAKLTSVLNTVVPSLTLSQTNSMRHRQR